MLEIILFSCSSEGIPIMSIPDVCQFPTLLVQGDNSVWSEKSVKGSELQAS